jgi:bis(5'-nucleosyl)-tetraphosphatase (symmetrical)
MTSYAIGDVQGCFDDLMQLLKKINFNLDKDELIFCGDLVNRGGYSLEVLRWIYAHQQNCQVTLGNHDLSLLAQYYIPKIRKTRNLEFKKIFEASDCSLLMDWLRKQKILIYLKKLGVVIVHAGIYPTWTLKRAKKEANSLEKVLQNNHIEFFKAMYGAKPNHWSKSLKGMDRARFVVNSFTRMRFLYKNGGLNFKAKGEPKSFPQLIPWYAYKNLKSKKPVILFGHWSALGLFYQHNVICLDTGKVWDGQLTALDLTHSYGQANRIIQV